MAKRYTSTLQLRCKKQHICASCSCVYAYVMNRKVVGTARSAERAQVNMRAQAAKTMRDENDLQPCPNCGQYQPDMIGLRLAKKRKGLAIAAFVPPILIPILRGTDTLQTNTLTWIAFAYCAVLLAIQLLLTLRDPNRDREANRTLAANRIVQGALEVQPMGGTPNPDTAALAPPSRGLGTLVTLAIFAGAVLLAVSPELLRGIRGWPLNPDCYPPVVGPSDFTRVYMTDSISSIKGFWRGQPRVTDTTPNSAGDDPVVEVRTNQNDWGSTIYAKSDEENTASHPWVEFRVPDRADLAGKTRRFHVDISVDYPEMSGGSNFQTAHADMSRDISVDLAPPGAGTQYDSFWWSATVIALVADFAACIALVYVARRYSRTAKPAEAFVLQPT